MSSENKPVLSPNLLDKASGIKSDLNTSNVKTSDEIKKGASPDLLDNVTIESNLNNHQSAPTKGRTHQR